MIVWCTKNNLKTNAITKKSFEYTPLYHRSHVHKWLCAHMDMLGHGHPACQLPLKVISFWSWGELVTSGEWDIKGIRWFFPRLCTEHYWTMQVHVVNIFELHTISGAQLWCLTSMSWNAHHNIDWMGGYEKQVNHLFVIWATCEPSWYTTYWYLLQSIIIWSLFLQDSDRSLSNQPRKRTSVARNHKPNSHLFGDISHAHMQVHVYAFVYTPQISKTSGEDIPYIYTYICICICIYINTNMRIMIYIHMQKYVYVYVCIYVCMRMHACMHVGM